MWKEKENGGIISKKIVKNVKIISEDVDKVKIDNSKRVDNSKRIDSFFRLHISLKKVTGHKPATKTKDHQARMVNNREFQLLLQCR